MKKILLLAFFSLGILSIAFGQAGEDRLAEIEKAAKKEVQDSSWIFGGGLGLDFAQLALINPRVGAGDNRIGFGGLVNLYGNYKRGRLYWNNNFSLQLAAQRIGGQDAPFQKNLDVMRLNSRVGYRPSDDGKLFMALEANARTLLLPTYPGNVLQPENTDDDIIAKFFSPIQVVVSPGIDYKVLDNLSLFFSPASFKMIYVADDSIAALNVHGNVMGKNSFTALGATFRATYTNKFLNERLSWASDLDLFSNYLENPQNIDIAWNNDLSLEIIKNLSLNLYVELFYDDDIDTQFDADGDGILGENESELAPSMSVTQALLIKYNLIF